MQTKQSSGERPKQCNSVVTERNRYFTGKYMTKRDFEHEQTYFSSRHQMHNRLLHGMGIVCELEVEHHPDPSCRNRWVVVRAGIAIDCCGRELILERDKAFELPLSPTSPADQASEPAQGRGDRDVMYDRFLLVLRYAEEEIEHVPAICSEDNFGSNHYEANRVREVAELDVLSLDDVHADCWKMPSGAIDPDWPTWLVSDCPHRKCTPEASGHHGSKTSVSEPAGMCLEPKCPCHKTVPLALITCDPDCVDAKPSIDITGRRQLPVSKEYLTHIVHTNWPHGGYITLADLRECGGRLEVHFDREILLPPAERGEGMGINEHTMIVQFKGDVQHLLNLPFHPENRPKLENGSVAVYTIDPDYVSGGGGQYNLEDTTVYVTLHCDFIVDHHGLPVDGNHMHGQLPSGDGNPGGDFRSWFHIIDRDSPPTIALAVSGPTQARPGEKVTLRLTVTNRSINDLHKVTIVKNPGLDDEEAIDECAQQLLSGGLSYTCPYNFRLPDDATSPYVITIQVSGIGEGRARARDTSRHVIQLVGAEQTLEVTKCLDKEADGYPNVLTYDITVKNNGAESLTDVVLVDRYWPKGAIVRFESSDPDEDVEVDESGRRVTWQWPELRGRSEKSITARMRVDFTEPIATVMNCARVSAEAPNKLRIRDSAKARTTIKQVDQDQV